jgi:hypothetical protein
MSRIHRPAFVQLRAADSVEPAEEVDVLAYREVCVE